MMRYLPIAAFAALVLALAGMLVMNHPDPQAETKPLPSLTLAPLDGNAIWHQEALNGQVTVINFFASWCVPCAAEMPELTAFKKQFPGIKLHGIAWNDDPATLRQWLKKNGNPFDAIWIDPKGDATIALGIRGVPETVFVDHRGMVRYRLTGIMNPQVRAQEIDALTRQMLEEASHAR